MSFMFGTVKKLVSKKEQTFRESIDKNKYIAGYARVSFLIKLQASGLQLY